MRKQFWIEVCKYQATLLSSNDCPDADVSPKDAAAFLDAAIPTGNTVAAMDSANESDEEEL